MRRIVRCLCWGLLWEAAAGFTCGLPEAVLTAPHLALAAGSRRPRSAAVAMADTGTKLGRREAGRWALGALLFGLAKDASAEDYQETVRGLRQRVQ